MSPAAWRKKAKISLRDLAVKLGGCAWSSARRYERGEHEAPNSVALAYEKISDGEVTGADLHRARKKFLAGKSAATALATAPALSEPVAS